MGVSALQKDTRESSTATSCHAKTKQKELEDSMDYTVCTWGRKESDMTERLSLHFTS